MATKWYTPKQRDKWVAAARKFVDGSIAGEKFVTIGKVTHEPRVSGRCSQFCRESVEAGLGLSEHSLDGILFGSSANVTAANMRIAGYSLGDTSDLQPGDFIYRPAGEFGHIAMYIGTDVPGHIGQHLFAENTSSHERGVPRRAGTKYTARGLIVNRGIGSWTEVFRLTKAVA